MAQEKQAGDWIECHGLDTARGESLCARLAREPLQHGEPPKDRVFYVRHSYPIRWAPYKPTSQQAQRGVKGRWQVAGEYGGWDNTLIKPEPGNWFEDVGNNPDRAAPSNYDALVKALRRIAALTPAAANADNAHDLYCTVSAIAETALAKATPHD